MRGHRRLVLPAVALALIGPALGRLPGAGVHAASVLFSVTTRNFPVVVGPKNNETRCNVVGDLYVPKSASAANPVPAILTTNGFGGSKDDQAGLGAWGASHGYEVLSYSGLGFGGSGCNIELDDPDWDGEAASQLISFLGHRPEVLTDGPDDPRVGMVGGSYGGGVQFATASVDPRLDAIIPIITWNDLAYSLTPNNDNPDFVYRNSPPGVPKFEWAELFFADGIAQVPQHRSSTPVPPSSCPGFDPRVCPANLVSGAEGYPSADTIALLRHASVATFLSKIKIPTMLMQGEGDTLFTIDEAVATYNALKDRRVPVPVKLVLQSWGHSHSTPAPREFSQSDPLDTHEGTLVVNWFDHYLKGSAVGTGPEVEYFRDWIPYDPAQTDAGPAYASASTWPVGTAQTLYLSASGLSAGGSLVTAAAAVHSGSASFVNPVGAQPTSYSETSGVQTSSPFSGIAPMDPRGEFVAFSTPPLRGDVDVVGIPTVDVRLSSLVPAGVSFSSDPVLFAKLYDVAPDGTVTLPARLVAPARIDATAGTVHVNLPGIVHRFAAGHRIELVLASTDAAYAGSRVPNVLTVSLDPARPSRLTLPIVGGTVS